MASPDAIDWKEVRRRIAETPVIVPPGPTKESLERRHRRDRERWNRYYHEHPEHCHARQRAWELAHSEKVKDKRYRYYEKLKQDPERLERKRQRNREYKARKRLAKMAA